MTMPYLTLFQTPKRHQLTLDEVLSGQADAYLIDFSSNRIVTDTVTRFFDAVPDKIARNFNVDTAINALESFITVHQNLYSADRNSLYRVFSIPKKTGGLRTISEPLPPLMDALIELRDILSAEMHALYHTAAFAYIKGRCTMDALKRHQFNGSRWFMKTDFSDFFGSTTKEFLMSMLAVIFPFSEIVKQQDSQGVNRGAEALSKAIDLCFLNGGLPQGTPISPMLTNLMMIPIDHYLYNTLRQRHFVYTRYADDIQISHQYSFDQQEIVGIINGALTRFNAPFRINPKKTRYGSSAGQNWNLGLMLNKDNKITIGWQRKKQFKAMCCNYINDRKNNICWDVHDVMRLRGIISYYMMIEKDYISYLLSSFNNKYNVNILRMIHNDIENWTQSE